MHLCLRPSRFLPKCRRHRVEIKGLLTETDIGSRTNSDLGRQERIVEDIADVGRKFGRCMFFLRTAFRSARDMAAPVYSSKNWDPTALPIILLGSVFGANSLGKWI
jgi:hypothetical protein